MAKGNVITHNKLHQNQPYDQFNPDKPRASTCYLGDSILSHEQIELDTNIDKHNVIPVNIAHICLCNEMNVCVRIVDIYHEKWNTGHRIHGPPVVLNLLL
jgi:hypothetical protein